MGMFDLFGRTPKTREERTTANGTAERVRGKDGPVAVFDIKSYEEVANVIDALKEGKNAVVHLEKLKTETALRIIDMLSGAIYALGGGLYEMEENIFMFSPSGLEIL